MEAFVQKRINNSKTSGNVSSLDLSNYSSRDPTIMQLSKLFPMLEQGYARNKKCVKKLWVENHTFYQFNVRCMMPSTMISSLHTLSLNNNSIREIASCVGALRNLRCLLLQNNSLETLPSEVAQLHALRELRVDGNCFTEFPTAIIHLRNLSVFSMLRNKAEPLSALPEALERRKVRFNEFQIDERNLGDKSRVLLKSIVIDRRAPTMVRDTLDETKVNLSSLVNAPLTETQLRRTEANMMRRSSKAFNNVASLEKEMYRVLLNRSDAAAKSTDKLSRGKSKQPLRLKTGYSVKLKSPSSKGMMLSPGSPTAA